MSLAPAGDVSGELVDPYGLWQPARAADEVSYALPGAGASPAPEGTLWQLDLTGDPRAAALALERRAGQVRAIAAGLDVAAPRMGDFLAFRAQARQEVSFDVAAPASSELVIDWLLDQAATPADEGASFGAPASPALPETTPDWVQPLARVELALEMLELLGGPGQVSFAVQAGTPGEASFGLRDDLAALARRTKERFAALPEVNLPNWAELQRQVQGLFDQVNHQLLHFAWVDTRLQGTLVARTTIDWAGDASTVWLPGLSGELSAAHRRSLALAVESRAASLRTVSTVAQIAAQVTLAVTTPLGPLQALGLGWQFVSGVILPMLKSVQ